MTTTATPIWILNDLYVSDHARKRGVGRALIERAKRLAQDTGAEKMMLDTEKPEEAPSIKVDFEKGDQIKIREGAFENFEGTVDSIDQERGIVKVIVTIFGRSTPLDIEYWQIEKT